MVSSLTFRSLLTTAIFFAVSIGFISAQAPANDLCANAQQLTVGASPTSGSLVNATENTAISCGAMSATTADVWYTFVAPSTGSIRVDLLLTGGQPNNSFGFTVWDGTCGSNPNLTCLVSSGSIVSSLIPFATYYVSVDELTFNRGGKRNFDFTIAVSEPPENSECAFATPLVNATPTVGGTSQGLSGQTIGCGGIITGPRFYYLATSTTDFFTVNLSGPAALAGDLQLSILRDNCNTPQALYCTTELSFQLSAGIYGFSGPFLLEVSYPNGYTGQGFTIEVDDLPPPIPANDNCPTATSITIGAAPLMYTFSGATRGSGAPFCSAGSGSIDENVWFSFIAPTSGAVEITKSNTVGGVPLSLTLFDGSCTNLMSLDCGIDSIIEAGLIPGDVYHVVVHKFYLTRPSSSISVANIHNFELGINALPSNSTCGTATNVIVDGAAAPAGLMTASPSGTATCTAVALIDTWYSFTAPANGIAELRIQNLTNASGFDVRGQLFEGDCSNLTAVDCFQNTCERVSGLTAGETYLVQYTLPDNVSPGASYDFAVTSNTPSANDECAFAKTVIVNDPPISESVVVTQSLTTATCGALRPDAWYSFVQPVGRTGAVIRITNGSASGTLFDGSCGTLNEVACIGEDETRVGGLIPGVTYYLAVYATPLFRPAPGIFTHPCSFGDLNFDLEIESLDPPANDNCEGAITLVPGDPFVIADTEDATPSDIPVGQRVNCGFDSFNTDVWFDFVATATEHVALRDNLTLFSGQGELTYILYDDDCVIASSGSELSCGTINVYGASLSNLTVGSSYLLRINITQGGFGQGPVGPIFGIRITDPPMNNECTGSETIIVDGPSVAGSIVDADPGFNTSSCVFLPQAYNDVWYSFVATATDIYAETSNQTGDATDLMMEVLTKDLIDCSQSVSILCSDPEDFQITGLTIGTEYLIRVGVEGVVPFANTGTYDLKLTTTPGSIAGGFITQWKTLAPNEFRFGIENSGPIPYTWIELDNAGTTIGSGSGTIPQQTGLNTFILSGVPVSGGSLVTIELTMDPQNLKHFENRAPGVGTRPYLLIDVKQWGTAQWTSMAKMLSSFNEASLSALDIPDLSSVTNTSSMFEGANSLVVDVSQWDMSNVINASSMFESAAQFNSDISQWDVSALESARRMFRYATGFSQDVSGWDVSNVTDFSSMFDRCPLFNSNISNWDISSATSLRSMFFYASEFNQDVSGWNTSGVTDLSYMFNGARKFNQDITGWDVSSVTTMYSTFSLASDFDQDLSPWAANFSNSINLSLFLDDAGLSCENYSNFIVALSQSPLASSSRDFGVLNLRYGTDAAPARTTLESNGWSFNGDAAGQQPCLSVPLPVDLVHFECNRENGVNRLRWVTASELNNSHFVIEHSYGNTDQFTALGMVGGQGTSTSVNNYQYEHPTSDAGSHYYRLDQVDSDGTTTYSNILAVEVRNDALETKGRIWPNPTTGLTYLHGVEEGAKVQVVNSSGQVVLQRTYDGTPLLLNELRTGIYGVHINSPGISISKRLIKQ